VTEYIIENNPKQGTTLKLDYDKEKDISFVEVKKTKKKKEEKEE
jgi:hypothetical protein